MVSMKELLQDAQQRNYALGAFNITSITYLDAVLEAAQQCHSPIILSISEHHITKGYIHLEAIARYISQRSKDYSIPIVLHLDHGETLSMIEKAIACGFTSMMIDRSHDSLEQNIKDTQTVVNLCKKKGLSVEGELGMIGGKEGDGHINTADNSLFTDPQTAYLYTTQTRIDALAIAIGNVHGRYAGDPNLDFQRLATIKDLVNLPLVLHGGSEISDTDFQKLIHYGIHKINFYSGNVQAGYKACQSFMDKSPLEKDIGELFTSIYKAVLENTKKQLHIFNSCSKA